MPRPILTALGLLLLLLVGVSIGAMLVTDVPDATAAGVFAVFVAAAAVLWEVARDTRDKKSHDALASAHAYQLRRALLAWTEPPWPADPEGLVYRVVGVWVAPGFNEVEPTLMALVSTGARGSGSTTRAVRDAFVNVTAAREGIRAVSAWRQKNDRDYDPKTDTVGPLEVPPEVEQQCRDVQGRLSAAVRALERVVDRQLLDAPGPAS